MKPWLRRIPRPKLLLALATLFALYLLLGGYFLPRYIERAIPQYVAEQLKRKASVRSVSFNPLLFKLELNDVVLMEADERLIARFRRLLVDFELSSLARWAWTFQTVALDGLEVLIDIAPDESVNLAALADSLPKGEPKPDAAPPRLVLQHIDITDAALTFSDRSGERPRFESVRALALELRDISTLPDHRGPYSIAARLPAGATLSWRGEVSLQPIFSAGEVELKAAKPATVWRFLQDELEIAEPQGEVDVALRYRTAYAKGALELGVEDLRVAARDLAVSLRGAKQPFFALKAARASGGRFDLGRRELRVPQIELRGSTVRAEIDAAGKLDLASLTRGSPAAPQKPSAGAPWRVNLESVRLGDIALQLRDLSRVAPLALGIGSLEADLSVALQTGAASQLTIGDIGVRLSSVTAGPADAEPLIALSSIALEGGSVDLAGQRFAARRLRLEGGSIQLAREADARLPLLDLFTSKIPKQENSGGKPWGLALDAFELQALKIALADRSFTPPVAYDIDPLTVAVTNISNEGRAPIRMEAALRVAQGGTLRVSGETVPAGNRASARATLERLSLKPLQPVVATHTTLALGSGDVSASVQAQYRALKDRAEVRASGSASLDDLLLAEAASGEPLLGWKSVAASGIAFSLAPDRLAVADIVLRGLQAKIVVAKDRSLNLAQAIRPAPDAAKSEPPRAEPFPLAIERVRLDKAAVDFSDLSLVLPFAAKIEDFEGDVLGLSTDRASRAVTKMEGRVDQFGLARVEGSLATFDPKAFLDLRVTFRNVEMVPLSPYTATFAGRRIEAGRLGLDVQYKIDKGALAGDNKVELDKFTLGERVEAPGALNLPLDLAVALLTDSEGRIALAVPVKGNVNEPEFSYGHVIWQAITTVLTNIVTAPFRALFGGGGDAVESIAFDAGRGALTPPEREKLKRVAEALAKRPQLKLVVEGQYGEADRAALRQRDVAMAISTRLEREVEGGEPQPVNARDARTQRALEELFVERASEQAFTAFAEETAKARGKPVQRVSRLAALTGNASEDGEFYDALLARLVESAPLPAEALEKLGAARAGAVEQHLVQALAVPAARVERKPASSADGVRAKLALDVAGSTKM
jgi:hypothetical protein